MFLFSKRNPLVATRPPITIGGHPLPRHAETQHVLVCGTTGTGKSTLIEEIIDGAPCANVT